MCILMRNYYTEIYNDFIEDVDLEGVHVKPIFSCDKNHHAANLIIDTAHKTNTDLIIAGSHGKTLFNKLLLGSFTEKLIRSNGNVPLLIVKTERTETT